MSEPKEYLGVLYRYEDVQHHPGLDECDLPLPGPGRVSLRLDEYRIKKKTPKGVWIDFDYGKDKFVNLYARKKYACSTKTEALESFLARKAKQISILKYQLIRAEKALDKGKELAHKDFYGKIRIWLSQGRDLFEA